MLSQFRSDPQNGYTPLYQEKKYYYDYLYLDPRVLCRMARYDQPELEELFNFYIFVSSIFYIGKGMGNRAVAHLQETRRTVKGCIGIVPAAVRRGWYQNDGILQFLRGKAKQPLYRLYVSNYIVLYNVAIMHASIKSDTSYSSYS